MPQVKFLLFLSALFLLSVNPVLSQEAISNSNKITPVAIALSIADDQNSNCILPIFFGSTWSLATGMTSLMRSFVNSSLALLEVINVPDSLSEAAQSNFGVKKGFAV